MPSALAQEKLAAKARRVRLLRRRIVAATLATFVMAWGVIAFDGSMGTTTVASNGTTATNTTTSSSDTTTSSSNDSTAPLTTSQS